MSDYLYTEAGVEALKLPGYKEPADIAGVFAGDNDWQSILSLTVLKQTEEGVQLMTGVRREDVNPTHPGVVSTPTKRLPTVIAKTLFGDKSPHLRSCDEFELSDIDPTNPLVVARFSPSIETLPDNSAVLPFVAADLMARKLGLAESLERSGSEKPLGKVSLQNILAGFSNATVDENTGAHLFEPLIVFGAVAMIEKPEEIPPLTSSYRNISWAPLEDFVEGVDHKDASLLIEGLSAEDEISVCVRGLCLATSRSNLVDFSNFADHLELAPANLGPLRQAA